jgi:hypothetical protein
MRCQGQIAHHVDARRETIGLAGCAGEVCTLRGDPPSVDRWLWIPGTRRCEVAQGTRSVRCDPTGHRRSISALDGLAHNRHGNSEWHCHPDRRLRFDGQHPCHHPARGSSLHGSSAVWFQLGQAPDRQQRKGTLRTARVRNRSPIYCVYGGVSADWSNSLVSRQLSIPLGVRADSSSAFAASRSAVANPSVKRDTASTLCCGRRHGWLSVMFPDSSGPPS